MYFIGDMWTHQTFGIKTLGTFGAKIIGAEIIGAEIFEAETSQSEINPNYPSIVNREYVWTESKTLFVVKWAQHHEQFIYKNFKLTKYNYIYKSLIKKLINFEYI